MATCPTRSSRSPTNHSCNHVVPSSPEELAAAGAIFDTTHFICQRVLCPLILVFGVPTNLINILVLTRKWMRSSTNIYLTAVALADTLYLILFFVVTLDDYPSLHAERHLWFQNARAISLASCNVLSNIATWLTCTFTIERYIAVSNPMLGRKVCTRRRARLATGLVSLIAFGLTFPDFLYQVGCRKPTRTGLNITEFALRKTAVYVNLSHYGWIYANQVLFVFAPLLLLGVTNGLLIRSVLRARRDRTALTRSEPGSSHRPTTAGGHGEQQRITVMLIAVVLVFCVLQLPSAVSVVIIALVKTRQACFARATLLQLQAMSEVANLMIMANAAANFLLYSAFSLKFRKTFQRLLADLLHRIGLRRHPLARGRDALGVTVTATPWVPGRRCSDISRSPSAVRNRSSDGGGAGGGGNGYVRPGCRLDRP